ncbi:MAG: hypothetical protein VW618_03550 [Alphaproteobacteria bacterium]
MTKPSDCCSRRCEYGPAFHWQDLLGHKAHGELAEHQAVAIGDLLRRLHDQIIVPITVSFQQRLEGPIRDA